MAEVQSRQHIVAADRAGAISKATNFAGAAVSLALIVGIGIWGYKLLVRDVSGIPVVRAAEGPMRVQPENPGGEEATNQGLAVNDVVAQGGAAVPADRLILAPEPLELTLEDEPVAARPVANPEPGGPAHPAESEDVHLVAAETLADQIAESVAPISDLEPATAEDTATPEEASAPRVTGGLGRSLRPKLRPAVLTDIRQTAAVAQTDAPSEVDPDSIPAGTRLAQLGAYESPEIARREWARLSDRFQDFLEGKERVVQKAQSGGRTFYRLRAMGFEDLSDARRFCSALVAEKAECIPVVTR